MSMSFDEQVQASAAKRGISYETAALIVAEQREKRDVEPDGTALDRPDDYEPISVYVPPSHGGRVVKIDSDPSPRYAIHRAAVVEEARREGDFYRMVSRQTSMHDPNSSWD